MCGATFTAPYRHPMIEEAHCPACLVIVRQCAFERFVASGALPDAARADDV